MAGDCRNKRFLDASGDWPPASWAKGIPSWIWWLSTPGRDTAQLAHLLKYDSVHRIYDAEVGAEGRQHPH